MSGPFGGLTPGAPYESQTLFPAGTPTAVGASFSDPGAAATVPDVPSAAIHTARNFPQTNARIPYARLVPLRGRGQYDADAGGATLLPSYRPVRELDFLGGTE